MTDSFPLAIVQAVPRRLKRFLVVVVGSTACYTASVAVTAPGVVVDRLVLVQTTPPLFLRDTVRLDVGDTLRLSFLPLGSGDVAVRGVLLRWDTGSPTVLRLLGATEQDAVADVRLVAESPGATTVTATTTNARTGTGQPLTWRGTAIVRGASIVVVQ